MGRQKAKKQKRERPVYSGTPGNYDCPVCGPDWDGEEGPIEGERWVRECYTCGSEWYAATGLPFVREQS